MRPDVVLVILDSARRDMFGVYGSNLSLTPNIDALAERGAVLNDHYAAANGSAPAHVSIFTGLYPARHRMLHNLCEMRQDLVPFPLLLRSLGYSCYGHCMASFIPPAGYDDLFGFDEMRYPGKAGAGTGGSLRRQIVDNLRGFPRLYQFVKKLYSRTVSKEGEVRSSAALHDGKDSMDYIIRHLKEKRGQKPVFAYTTLLHPHTPYYPPASFLNKVFNGQKPHPVSFEIQRNFHAFMNGDFGQADEALESVRKCYQADLLYGDHLVGKLVEELDKNGLFENTILIVTSDHGELLGEHGAINHGATLWEELFAIPCVISYPPRIEGGFRIGRLTSALDLAPTIFDLLGESGWMEDQVVMDGVSVLSEEEGLENRRLVVDSPPAVLPERLKAYPNLLYEISIIRRGVRTGDWKYIWQSNGEHQLYRAGDKEVPENNRYTESSDVVAPLHQEMISFYEGTEPDFALDRYPVPLSKEIGAKMTDPLIRRELQRLGYM
ncbi:MAG: sulfatase [bacterium]|nr:sulfatase [bacterium]